MLFRLTGLGALTWVPLIQLVLLAARWCAQIRIRRAGRTNSTLTAVVTSLIVNFFSHAIISQFVT